MTQSALSRRLRRSQNMRALIKQSLFLFCPAQMPVPCSFLKQAASERENKPFLACNNNTQHTFANSQRLPNTHTPHTPNTPTLPTPTYTAKDSKETEK